MSGFYGLHETHFCSLQSQSNIYGLTVIKYRSGKNKVLVSSLSGEVLLIEYQHGVDSDARLGPLSKPLQLTYIPTTVEVISIDAFTKVGTGGGELTVVGVAIAKATVPSSAGGTASISSRSQAGKYFLNIYSTLDENLNNLSAEGGSPFELTYIPCQLTHTATFVRDLTAKTVEAVGGNIERTVFLLGGTDGKVHVFGEVAPVSSQGRSSAGIRCLSSSQSVVYFPEFDQAFEDDPLWVDVRYSTHAAQPWQRVTSVGCRRGAVYCFVVAAGDDGAVLLQRMQTGCVVGPVTSVRLFVEQDPGRPHRPTFLRETALRHDGGSRDDSRAGEGHLHLLVTSALDASSVFRNILEKQLTDQVMLPGSEAHDCVLGSCVADVDFDGRNELLLATYGQKILAFKFSDLGPVPTLPLWEYMLPYPAFSVQSVDMNSDGLRELVALSSKGVHMLQYDVDAAAVMCKSRLRQFLASYDDDSKNIDS